MSDSSRTGPLAAGVGPRDDSTIPGDAVIWRRIHPAHDIAGTGLSSAAFDDSGDGTPMSATMPPPDHDIVAYAGKWKAYGIVCVTVRDLRELGLGVTLEPTEDDPFHVFIHGTKTKSIKKKIREKARWVFGPNR